MSDLKREGNAETDCPECSERESTEDARDEDEICSCCCCSCEEQENNDIPSTTMLEQKRELIASLSITKTNAEPASIQNVLQFIEALSNSSDFLRQYNLQDEFCAKCVLFGEPLELYTPACEQCVSEACSSSQNPEHGNTSCSECENFSIVNRLGAGDHRRRHPRRPRRRRNNPFLNNNKPPQDVRSTNTDRQNNSSSCCYPQCVDKLNDHTTLLLQGGSCEECSCVTNRQSHYECQECDIADSHENDSACCTCRTVDAERGCCSSQSQVCTCSEEEMPRRVFNRRLHRKPVRKRKKACAGKSKEQSYKQSTSKDDVQCSDSSCEDYHPNTAASNESCDECDQKKSNKH